MTEGMMFLQADVARLRQIERCRDHAFRIHQQKVAVRENEAAARKGQFFPMTGAHS